MSSPVTEVVTLNANDVLKADPSLLLELTQLVKNKRAPGLQRQVLGSGVEEPERWQWFLDWESLEHHKKVQALPPTDSGFKEKAAKLFAGPPKMVHVPFTPFEGYTKAVAAPVTEVAFATFKDSTDIQNAGKIIEKVLAAVGKAEGCVSWAWGNSVEEERQIILIIGWESIQAHEKYANTDVYQADTASLVGLFSEVKMSHFKFQQIKM